MLERGEGGAFLSKVTDVDIITELERRHAAGEDTRTRTLAAHFGLAQRSMQQRLARLRRDGIVRTERHAEPLPEETAAVIGGPDGDELWQIFVSCDANKQETAKVAGLPLRECVRRLTVYRDARWPEKDHDDRDPGEKVRERASELLNAIPDRLPDGGRIARKRYSGWTVAAKDNFTSRLLEDGRDSVQFEYRYPKDDVQKWPLFAPIVVKGYRSVQTVASRYKRALFVGDTQFGYWAQVDPADPFSVQFIPFHGDGRAVDAVLRAIAIYKPHRIVIMGDFWDFAMFSRFTKEPGFKFTLQASFTYGRAILALIRDAAPDDCEIDFIPGNHETRLTRAVIEQIPDLYDVRRPGESDPIHALRSIMQLDELGIRMASEYPSGEVWVHRPNGKNPGLIATHAPLAGTGSRSVFRANAVHGHLVLAGLVTKNVFDYDEDADATRGVPTWAACCSGTGNYSDATDRIRITRTMTPSGRANMAHSNSLVTVDINPQTDGMQPFVWLINDGRIENFYDQGAIVGKPIEARDVLQLTKAA